MRRSELFVGLWSQSNNFTLEETFYLEDFQLTGNFDLIMPFKVFTFSTHFGSESMKSSFTDSGKFFSVFRNMKKAVEGKITV